MGDLFMLIYTCELCGANPFHYLTELQRHTWELKQHPEDWLPRNYRDTMARTGLLLASWLPRGRIKPAAVIKEITKTCAAERIRYSLP